MNRRTFSVGVAVAGAASLRTSTLAQDYLHVTPEAMVNPGATPPGSLLPYDGPIDGVWQQPWAVEGKLIAFNGIIIRREVAPDGAGLPTGLPGDTVLFRAQLIMELPQARSKRLVVATNDDLRRLAGYHTAHVVGTYGGEQNLFRTATGGASSNAPLIIATAIDPVSAGTPEADATPVDQGHVSGEVE